MLEVLGLRLKIIKIYNIRGFDVVFDVPVDYLWNGWVKTDGVYSNLV